METLITAIIFFIILSVLVLVHEAGHYFAAKRAGVKVEEFGFGLPPRIWGRQRGETEFTINALPIGGFVRLFGESPDGVSIKDQASAKAGSAQEQERMFLSKSKKARSMILLAGVTANLVLGMLIFTVVYSFGLPHFDQQPVVIKEVHQGSPAAEAGLLPGDIITNIEGGYEGEELGTLEFSQLIMDQVGQPVNLTIIDEDQAERQVTVTPRADPPAGQGAMGIVLGEAETYVDRVEQYPIWQAWYVGIKDALQFAWTIVVALGGMVAGIFSRGQVPSDISGPVGIAAIIGEARSLGMIPVLWFAGIISINLAVINVLPLPALDGGRMVFVIIEAVTGRKVNEELERKVHTAGMIALLALIALITFADIRRLLFG